MSLPAPYYEDEHSTIYLGDCRDILPHLPKVDAVVTDPPYGVLPEKWDKFSEEGFNIFNAAWMSQVAQICDRAFIFSDSTRNNIESMARLMFRNVRRLIWDKLSSSTGDDAFWFAYEEFFMCDNLPPVEFAQPKFLDVADEIKRLRTGTGLSRGGVDMVVRGKKTGLCYRWEEGACLPTKEQLAILSQTFSGDMGVLLVKVESAIASKENTLAELREYNSKNGARFNDVLRFPVSKKTDHPCEKPTKLINIILDASNADTILDPFMGSGTTLVAAKQLGRHCIGIELEEKYCETAVDRLRQGVLGL